VDLGSLELTLEEIAALRAGHLLDLDSQLPAACFLRIGSTVIAEGVLDSAPAGLVIQLKKIVDIDATPEALFAM
jgi:flagellar motor switch/type III secretory pathway protein FliN